jgi:DNA polymerase III delta prime subunit
MNVWVEKYRPTHLDDVALSLTNKLILNNILLTQNLPNLLLYGPAGTGKTTTVINFIRKYYEQQNVPKYNELIIHLNASDERGIDIVRNTIHDFINSTTLFQRGMKFVVLDEVDHMTKCAQRALHCLLQTCNIENVRFFLMCNYLSKIDTSLQNEFVKLRFHQIPPAHILSYLREIATAEKLKLKDSDLMAIQSRFKTDVRSMVNFMQTNQNQKTMPVLTQQVYATLLQHIVDKKKSILFLKRHILSLQKTYNMGAHNILTEFITFLICERGYSSPSFLDFAEEIVHSSDDNVFLLDYFFTEFRRQRHTEINAKEEEEEKSSY